MRAKTFPVQLTLVEIDYLIRKMRVEFPEWEAGRIRRKLESAKPEPIQAEGGR